MKRQVITHPNGVRIVHTEYGLSESWDTYTIVPRSTLLDIYRHFRAAQLTMREAYNAAIFPRDTRSFYGGPGQAYFNGERIVYKTRRFYTLCASGGMDV